MLDEQPAAPNDARDGSRVSYLAEISNRMVALYKEQFGRGPTKAKTAWAGPNALVCTLEDSFTPAERNLAQIGQHWRLHEVRLLMQHAAEHKMRGIVEELSGRKVRAFVSGIDADADLAAEIFYLEPFLDASPEADHDRP